MIKSAEGVSAKVLRQVSHQYKGRFFVGLDDLAQALKMPANAPWVIPNLATGMAYLQRMGVVGSIKKVVTADNTVRMLPRDGSVVMIAVHVMKNGKVIGGHAFRNTFGQVRFMGKTVSATRGVYKVINELERCMELAL